MQQRLFRFVILLTPITMQLQAAHYLLLTDFWLISPQLLKRHAVYYGRQRPYTT